MASEKLSERKSNYCSHMRRLFSPPEMLDSADKSSIDPAYFRPKNVTDGWSDLEHLKLLKGVEEFGLHNETAWSFIQQKYLQKRQFVEIRVECCRLIGRQNLKVYESWKGKLNETTIEQEKEKNRQRGIENNSWIGEVYLDGEILTETTLLNLDSDKISNISENTKCSSVHTSSSSNPPNSTSSSSLPPRNSHPSHLPNPMLPSADARMDEGPSDSRVLVNKGAKR
eukprot:85264_1